MYFTTLTGDKTAVCYLRELPNLDTAEYRFSNDAEETLEDIRSTVSSVEPDDESYDLLQRLDLRYDDNGRMERLVVPYGMCDELEDKTVLELRNEDGKFIEMVDNTEFETYQLESMELYMKEPLQIFSRELETDVSESFFGDETADWRIKQWYTFSTFGIASLIVGMIVENLLYGAFLGFSINLLLVIFRESTLSIFSYLLENYRESYSVVYRRIL